MKETTIINCSGTTYQSGDIILEAGQTIRVSADVPVAWYGEGSEFRTIIITQSGPIFMGGEPEDLAEAWQDGWGIGVMVGGAMLMIYVVKLLRRAV